MMFALSDSISPAPSFPAPWPSSIRLQFARAARALRMVAVAGGAIAAAGVSEPEAATFDLILNSSGVPLTQGTFEVPDALLGPANANGFIRFSQFIKFDITINESRFDLPGDIIYDPDDGLALDASGQPLLFRNIGWSSAYLIDDDRTAPLSGQNYLLFVDGSYPRWFMRDYWTGQSWGGDAYYIRKQAPPIPKIYSAGNDITGTSQKIVVGQRISVTAIASYGVIASQNWLIKSQVISPLYSDAWRTQGGPIGDFKVTSTTGKVIPITESDYQRDYLVFSWTLPGTYVLTYDFTRADRTKGKVHVTYNVVGPTRIIKTKTSNVQIIDNRSGKNGDKYKKGIIYLGCGNSGKFILYPTIMPACIYFDGSLIRNPKGYDGTLFWVQTISLYQIIYNKTKKCGQSAGATLDRVYPYGDVYQNYVTDSPAVALYNTDTRTSTSFRANMYLMWVSKIKGSVPVPLGYVDWMWAGEVSRTTATAPWRLGTKIQQPKATYWNLPQYPAWNAIHVTTPCK